MTDRVYSKELFGAVSFLLKYLDIVKFERFENLQDQYRKV